MTSSPDNGAFSNLAPWVKIAFNFGVPTAIVAVLIYVLFFSDGGISATVQRIDSKQEIHIQQSDDHHKEFHEAEDRRANESIVIRDLLRAQCVNSAQNAEDRARCFPPVVK